MRKKLSIVLFVGLFVVVGIFIVADIADFLPYFDLGPDPQEANIVGFGSLPPPDWVNLFDLYDGINEDGTGPGWFRDADSNDIPDYIEYGGVGAVFIQDGRSSQGLTEHTVFAMSNKNDDPVSSWHWKTGGTPNKDDLSNIYAYATLNADDDLVLYVGLERLAPNGASHLDVGFHQQEIGINYPPECPDACEFYGQKTVGDIMVVIDFTQGGDLAFVEVYTWTGTNYSFLEKAEGEGCSASNWVCGFNNGYDILGGLWPSYDTKGNVLETLPRNAFTEIGINVTKMLGFTPCLKTVMAKSRSAPGPKDNVYNSELKDFALGYFDLCSIEVTKEGPPISKAGDDVTYNYTIQNTGVAPLWLDSVTDDPVGDLESYAGSCDLLEVGESCEFDVPYTIPANAYDPEGPDVQYFPNTVTAVYNSASDMTGTSISNEAEWEIELFDPSIEVTKTVDQTLSKPTDSVTYTYTITNTSSSNSPPLYLDSITDSNPDIGDLEDEFMNGCSSDDCLGEMTGFLNPGAECTFDVEYEIPLGTEGPLVNTFTVHFHPVYDCGGANEIIFSNDVSETSDEVEVDIFHPEIDVTLTTDCDYSKAGDVITYRATVQNISTSSGPIPDLVLDSVDATYKDEAIDASGCTPLMEGDLPCEFSWTYTVTGDEPDPLPNTVTVHYHPEYDSLVFSNDIDGDASKDVDIVHPDMTLEKSCSPPIAWRGQLITNTVTITNTSTDAALDRIQVGDTLMNGATLISETDLTAQFPATLAPGQSETVQYSYTVPMDVEHMDQLINTVTATYEVAIECLPNQLTKQDTCTVEIRKPVEGCTPGFWKNHLDVWVGYSPGDSFNATFGVTPALSGLDDGITLFEALSVAGDIGDGDLMALNRHATAALLNAAYDDTTLYYAYTPAQVISMYQAAVNSGSYGPTKEAFRIENEKDCPID